MQLFLMSSTDKDELNKIDQDMNKLRISELALDEDDDRDALIVKLQDVNEKLKIKLKDLEVLVENTVEKAYQAAKQTSSQREWEPQTEELAEKDNKIKQYQREIEHYKKTVRGLKNRMNALTNMDKMVTVNNQLKDAERRRKTMEDEVKILKKNNKYQERALGRLADDTDYESKMQSLSQELSSLRDEYRQMGKDNKAKEITQMEHHQKMVSAEEENARLKRILIALKNNKDPFDGNNNVDDLVLSGKKEVEGYEQAIKSEDKRHKMKLKKLEDLKEEIKNETKELENQIKNSQQENHQTADKIKSKKKMIKENTVKLLKAQEEQRLAEEKAKEEEEKRLLEERQREINRHKRANKKDSEDDNSDKAKFYDQKSEKSDKSDDSDDSDDSNKKKKKISPKPDDDSPKRNVSNSPLSSKKKK